MGGELWPGSYWSPVPFEQSRWQKVKPVKPIMIIFIQINGNKSSWITIKFKDFFGQSRWFCSVQQVPLVETRARSQHFQTNTRPPLLSAWGPEGSRKRPNALLNSTVKHCNVATTTANGFHLGLLEILKTQPLFSSLSPILLHSHSNSSGPWRALELFGSGTKLRKKRHFNSIFKLLNWCNDGWKMFLNLMVFCVCFTIYKKSLNKNTSVASLRDEVPGESQPF